MQTIAEVRNHRRHDAMLRGENSSYMVVGGFPADELARLLPKGMSIPSDATMAERYPTLDRLEGAHPFVMMFSNCRNVHDVITEIKLRPYRELMFFIPVSYSHGAESRLCSYVPTLYLEYLLGVIGGLYLGLRKEFHPRMRDNEAETSKQFTIDGILDARFDRASGGDARKLHPFFVQTLANPTVTRSYFNRTRFYTTSVFPTAVCDATADVEWRFKGSVIRSGPDAVADYAEYEFTTSQAMGYNAYFHPKYPRVRK